MIDGVSRDLCMAVVWQAFEEWICGLLEPCLFHRADIGFGVCLGFGSCFRASSLGSLGFGFVGGGHVRSGCGDDGHTFPAPAVTTTTTNRRCVSLLLVVSSSSSSL